MAIRLEYKTCQFEEAFDQGVNDMLRVIELKKLQEEERVHYEKSLIDIKEQAEADGEVFKASDKKWEVIEPKPFLTRTVKLVCCLNTMGQDRKFTAEEKLKALRIVKEYRDLWEQSDQQNLKSDIEIKIANLATDSVYKETQETLDIAEMEARAEAHVQRIQ